MRTPSSLSGSTTSWGGRAFGKRPRRPGDGEERRVEPRECRPARKPSEVEDEVVDAGSDQLGGPPDEAEELRVVIGLAHDVDWPAGQDLLRSVGAEAREREVAEAREDDPVH